MGGFWAGRVDYMRHLKLLTKAINYNLWLTEIPFEITPDS